MKKVVFGHKSPDTDSICSAIVYAKGARKEVTPYRLGDINKETEYVLNTLNIEVPNLLEQIEQDMEVVLVDHNEFGQSVSNINDAKVVEVYDHHRVSNFETKDPITISVMPVGCTSTVLYTKYKHENTTITKEMASLMLSAIISDTLLFKSPTCTKKDVEAAKDLEAISGLNMQEYGMNLLKAGTDLGEFSTDKLLDLDTKAFETANGKYEVGQINTVDVEEILSTRGEELISKINKRIDENKLDAFMFIITDIVNSDSKAYVLGNNASKIAKDFNKELKDNMIDLPGVVSRKKQIVPFL